MAAFYIIAGLNHFAMPDFYYGLIPEYLVFPKVINSLAGLTEVVLGSALMLPKLRKAAAWGVVLMLLAFIPAHSYFIEIGSCIGEGLCVPEWISWLRLLLIHPLLILWAVKVARINYQ
jgi:uncharacterized membrane protein